MTLKKDQFGNVFSCGFISEPGLESIQIIDMDAEDVNESIVYESSDVTADVVQVEPGTGRYECKVTNSLGTTTKFIVLHPQGMFYLKFYTFKLLKVCEKKQKLSPQAIENRDRVRLKLLIIVYLTP